MIEEGVVQTIGTTEKGTPKIQIAGKNYFAGRGVDVTDIQVGQKVLVEYELFGDRKNVRGMKSWSLSPNKDKPNGTLNEPVNQLSEGERAFCSNVIAHAIDAKLITAHTDLTTWVKAALDALRHHDDDIPY